MSEELTAPEVVQEIQDQPKKEQQQPQESDKEMNFRKIREEKEKLAREFEEYKARHEQPKEEVAQDEDDDFDFANAKDVSKLNKDLASIRSEMQRSQLKSKFSDFDNVVNAENLKRLQEQEPELYASLNKESDVYNAGVSVYKTLRAFRIAPDEYEGDKAKAHENSHKPLSSQALKGTSAMAEANRFTGGAPTDALKKELLKEMQDATKGY